MIDEFNLPERTPYNAEVSGRDLISYYDKLIQKIQNRKRGALIDMSGRLWWLEDYDAWQLRLKELDNT